MQRSNNHTHEQSVEQPNNRSRPGDHAVDASITSAYTVWISPSSSFFRVFFILVIWSFVISLVCCISNRISCIFRPMNEWFALPPSGFRGHLILNIGLMLVWLIPSDFISLFVWHFAFHSVSDGDTEHHFIDFSTLSGLKAFFVDVKSCICCRRPCAARDESSACSPGTHNHTTNQQIIRQREVDVECKSEILLYEFKLTVQPFANSDLSDHRLNEAAELAHAESKVDDHYNALVDIQQCDEQSHHHHQLIRRSKLLSIKQSIADVSSGRTRWRVQPLYWLTTPPSIYGVIWRNHLVNWLVSLLLTAPWNLSGRIFVNNEWLGKLVENIFGARPTEMITFSNSIQLVNEYLLLPMFYRKPIHSLRTSRIKKRRSIMMFTVIPLFFLVCQLFEVRAIMDEPPDCFLWCTMFPNFSIFMMSPLTSKRWSVSIMFVFGVLSFLQFLDEIWHFGGCQPRDHRKCSCRWSYVMVLILLVSQSAGFITVAFAAYHYFTIEVQTELVEFMSTHVLLIWWQLLVTSVAQKALPDLYADAVIFPVLLLDDFISSLLFLQYPPFSVLFFLSCGTQVIKAVIRDLSLFSRLYEMSMRAVRRLLRLRVAMYSINSIRRRQLSRRVVRYQSFMVEICSKVMIIGALLVDAIPLYQDAPVIWTPLNQIHTAESVVRSLEMMSALFVMTWTHCVVHFVLMKVVDRLDRKELADPALNHQVFDAHWQKCFLFWFVCLTKIVPLVIFLFASTLTTISIRNIPATRISCEIPSIGLFGQPLASLTFDQGDQP